jgi:2-polyprenyl-3-methyl-5-hydroxy-6-metoxy-1,4-benzoquinol methylase
MKPESQMCPFCGKNEEKKISSTLRFCKKCKIIFNTNHKSLSYDRDYFIKEYKEQYGKTYIEDYGNIYNLSLLRLERISQFIDLSYRLSLLDIGSATGFFLKAAKDKGVETLLGIEISSFAANYCRDNFNINVIEASFEDLDLHKRFDIITSWFFIEHCADPLNVLKRIYSMLNQGGVFAFSVPSFFGPMFYFDRVKWIVTHPSDHRIDLSPRSAKRILKSIGFRKVEVIKSGYHPERVLSKSSIFYNPFELFYKKFTDKTAFSDTIEIYAVK